MWRLDTSGLLRSSFSILIGTAVALLAIVPSPTFSNTHAMDICLKLSPGETSRAWRVSGCGAEFPIATRTLYVVLSGEPMGTVWSVGVTDAQEHVVTSVPEVAVKHEPSVVELNVFSWSAGAYTVTATGRDGSRLAEASFTLVDPRQGQDVTHLIVPGLSAGPIRLGMNITDAIAAMGKPKATYPNADGTVQYMWYENVVLSGSTGHGGIGLRATVDTLGTVQSVTVHYDPQYATAGGVHVGMTEPQAKAAMGVPSRVVLVRNVGHLLVYDSGIALLAVDNPKLLGHGTVAEIEIVPRTP
jgi:hypothetical protein